MKYDAYVSISHKTCSVGPRKHSVNAVGVYDSRGYFLSNCMHRANTERRIILLTWLFIH
jgi:hypothetical protein